MDSQKNAAEVGFLLLIPAVALSFFPSVSDPFALKQEFALLVFGAALLYWIVQAAARPTSDWK